MADKDAELGIAIRMIRQWDLHDSKRVDSVDVALGSCAFLGHTWRINVGEPFCGVCGAPNLTVLKGE